MRKNQYQLLIGIIVLASIVVSLGVVYYFSLKLSLKNQPNTTSSFVSTISSTPTSSISTTVIDNTVNCTRAGGTCKLSCSNVTTGSVFSTDFLDKLFNSIVSIFNPGKSSATTGSVLSMPSSDIGSYPDYCTQDLPKCCAATSSHSTTSTSVNTGGGGGESGGSGGGGGGQSATTVPATATSSTSTSTTTSKPITTTSSTSTTTPINTPPTITNGVYYTGIPTTNQQVTLWCDANDSQQSSSSLSVKLWVGTCNPSNCTGTKSWDLIGVQMTWDSGSTFKYVWNISYSVGTTVASTCQAYDNQNAASNWGDKYPLFTVVAVPTTTTTTTSSSTTTTTKTTTTSSTSTTTTTISTTTTSTSTMIQAFGGPGLEGGDVSGAHLALRFIPSVNMTVTNVGLNSAASSGHAYVGIYSDSGGAPNSLLASSNEATLSLNWNDIPLTSPVQLKSGTAYWIAFHTDLNSYPSLYYSTLFGNSVYAYDSYGPLPSSFGTATTQNNVLWNMRITYTTTSTINTTTLNTTFEKAIVIGAEYTIGGQTGAPSFSELKSDNFTMVGSIAYLSWSWNWEWQFLKTWIQSAHNAGFRVLVDVEPSANFSTNFVNVQRTAQIGADVISLDEILSNSPSMNQTQLHSLLDAGRAINPNISYYINEWSEPYILEAYQWTTSYPYVRVAEDQYNDKTYIDYNIQLANQYNKTPGAWLIFAQGAGDYDCYNNFATWLAYAAPKREDALFWLVDAARTWTTRWPNAVAFTPTTK